MARLIRGRSSVPKTTADRRGRLAAHALLLIALLATVVARPAGAAPLRLLKETALDSVPGTIVAWFDSAWVCVDRGSDNREVLRRVNRVTRAGARLPLGERGRGSFLSLAPDGITVMVRETDSTGVHWLEAASFANPVWNRVLPVTDPDPHLAWFSDSRGFLYQDILDDKRATPSIFRMTVGERMPRLYMIGGQRPLVAPTDDAVVCVSVDTLNVKPTRNIEQFQPVGVEDLKAGDYYQVAPLRTSVPDRCGWSPDGQRLALVGYVIDSTAVSRRRVYVHSRITRTNRVVELPGDDRRPGRDNSSDVAVWSPDGEWFAVGMVAPRGGEPGFKGGLWLISKTGQESTLITPADGAWRGVPIWIGRRQILMSDLESANRRYWILDLGG